MWNIHHQPTVQNAPNTHVFVPEHTIRLGDITNSIDHTYEYTQPSSWLIVADIAERVINPFDTPAQFGLYYIQIADSPATFQIAIDNSDTSVIPLGINAVDVPGIVLIGSIITAFSPPYWFDFREFITIKTSGITNKMNFVLVFRRKREQMIPRNPIALNELTQ